MKKIVSILLCAVMVLSALALVSCGNTGDDTTTPETLKLGLGVYSTVESATSADGDTNGKGKVAITAAVVLVNAEGKIVKCVLDTMDNEIAYTSEGKAIANASFATKYELGDDYGMKTEWGSKKEWYEHANAFVALVEGKTITEVKALVADGGKGKPDVISAGCTITVTDFVLAIEKAVSNAKIETTATTIKLGMNTTQTVKDATDEKSGSNKVATDIFAAAVDAEGKIVAATNETVEVDFTFDVAGVSTFDTTKAVEGKREQGDAYGMKCEWGSKKEWYEHADAFVAACIGKKASEVASLNGNTDLVAAGCTISIDGFIKAASKVG